MALHQLLQDAPGVLLVFAGLLGLLVGSFLNVVIHRLPVMLEREWAQQCRELHGHEGNEADAGAAEAPYNLVVPRSGCPKCGAMISARDNIPLLSYILLKGRCRHCGTHIPLRYPVVEALTGVLTLAVVWQFGLGWPMVAALALTWSLIALTFIDLDHQILPDSITQPILWLGVAVSLFGIFVDPRSSIIGALSGYLSLWTVYWMFKLFTGKEGMGYGDFKLLALLGAWLGWQILPLTVLLSAAVGAVIGIALILLRRHEGGQPMPFGPYLAGAGWIALMWGNDLTNAYLGYVGLG